MRAIERENRSGGQEAAFQNARKSDIRLYGRAAVLDEGGVAYAQEMGRGFDRDDGDA